MKELDWEKILGECTFITARSGGSGGQNVNKVETKVTLQFDVENSLYINNEIKDIINKRLCNKINQKGILAVSSETHRTQQANRKATIEKFQKLLLYSLKEDTPRVATKPSKSSIMKRLEMKKKISDKKRLRSKDF